jgi:hypothetical protein
MKRQKIKVSVRNRTEETMLEFPDKSQIMVSRNEDGFIYIRTLDHRFILHFAGAVNVVKLEMRRFSE